jgi:hypothetical protein
MMIRCGPGLVALGSGQVRWERDLLRRSSLRLAPVLERLPVTTYVLAGRADRDEDAWAFAAVRELAAGRGGNAYDLVLADLELVVLECESQRPPQHEIDLFLLSVAVDTTSLPGLERDQVDAEAGNSKLAAKGDESLVAFEIECRSSDACHLAILHLPVVRSIGRT